MNKTRNQHKTEIQSAAIYRCTDKHSHEVFYMVKSDSSDDYYRLTWNGTEWHCNCPATKPCKHMRAVNEVIAARNQQEKAKAEIFIDRAKVNARIDEQIKAARKVAPRVAEDWTEERRTRAPLNGSRAFSLMR